MSPDDEWRAECDRVCARAMAQWLKGTVNPKRSMLSITMAEMTALARVAVDTWIVESSYRAERQRPYDDPEITLA